MSQLGPKPFLCATPPRWPVGSHGHWLWHARGHPVAIVDPPFSLCYAPFRASFLAVAAATRGRRCGVPEAGCRGIGKTVPCELRDRPRPLWDFGSLHQEPRVGGTLGALRDGSGGLRSPVPRGDNSGGRGRVLPPPTIPCRVPPTGCVHRGAFWCGQSTRWQVLYVRTGSLSRLQSTTLRRLCGQLLRQQQKGQHPEGGCWSAVSGEQEAEGR